MGDSKIFKCGFDITDYRDIIPSLYDYERNDACVNSAEHKKGNIDNCVWVKNKPSIGEINSPEFRERENRRILKTGIFIWISDEIVWIPPNEYFKLQYCPAGSSAMQFRLKRLKHAYFKIRARMNAGCKGTLTIKSRGDGETTSSVSDGFWECLDGNMDIGQIGIQSRTRGDSLNPCWGYVQALWQSLPQWLKSDLCSDFDSGDSIAEKMKWMRDADEQNDINARNVLYTFYASGTPMDGKHDVKKCILDEICKWEECSFYETFTNYSKFIMPGFERRGMFDMFSSPADKICTSNDEVYQLWKDSDTDEITDNGTTKSRIHRYYSNPLDGIGGAYDKFGDADPDAIYAHIMSERKKMPKDKLFAEIRGFPLNEEEMFGSAEGGHLWSNHKGISDRKIYLLGTRFKNEKTQEPTVVYGNLERIGGYIDGDVEFRMSDLNHFDLKEARFCFSYLPKNKEPLKNIYQPPSYIESCLGVDPFNNRYPAKHVGKQSNGAMVNRVFRDLFQRGYNRCPTMIYCCRPSHQEIFFEDVLKAGIFNRSMIQYENRSDKLANYAEDRGYFDWLLPEIGEGQFSKRKGDAPSGKGAFLEEGMGLINANTNVPLNPDDPYYLEYHWFIELLDDYLNFNPLDTHVSDLAMSDIQSLIGSVKIMYKKIRQPSSLNTGVLDYLLS
jgi:hypothetical protein